MSILRMWFGWDVELQFSSNAMRSVLESERFSKLEAVHQREDNVDISQVLQ